MSHNMKILHIDIETAPNKVYSWGLFNQNIAINQIVEPGYTLCWAAKWHGKPEILFDSIHESSERDMLEKMWMLLDKADVVTHYNGKKFDIPTLNKEFIIHEMGVPAPYQQVDLLQVTRSSFRFPSNKLDYVAQALGLGSKTKHMGMDLWSECMRGEEASWKIMKKYNKQDVVLLEKLYKRLLPWVRTHPNHALFKETDKPVCTNCGSARVQKRGITYTRTQQYQRYQCSGCGTWLRGRSTILDKEKRKDILIQATH